MPLMFTTPLSTTQALIYKQMQASLSIVIWLAGAVQVKENKSMKPLTTIFSNPVMISGKWHCRYVCCGALSTKHQMCRIVPFNSREGRHLQNSATLDRQIALKVRGKRYVFDLGVKRPFETLPWCCESPLQETTTAQIGHQKHNAHCQRYQCCLQSIVKVKDNNKKSETSARLHWHVSLDPFIQQPSRAPVTAFWQVFVLLCIGRAAFRLESVACDRRAEAVIVSSVSCRSTLWNCSLSWR